MSLLKSPILARLEEPEAAVVLGALEQESVTAERIIVREGEESDGMFFVLEGEAVVERGGVDLRTLRPGDHFGEIGLVGLRPRAATVRALGAMRLGRMSSKKWMALSEEHPKVALHFTQSVVAWLADQLVRATDSAGLLLGQRSMPRRLELVVTALGDTRTVPPGVSVASVLPADFDGAPVVAAQLDRRPVSLFAPVVSASSIVPITTATWDGRDVVRRSAALALLESANAVAPDVTIRMSGSLGSAQTVDVEAEPSRAEDLAARLDAELQRRIARGDPFREEVWATEEAATQLTDQGWAYGARLLASWREATVELASVGEIYALRTGPFVRTTAEIKGARVVARSGRVFLDFGSQIASRLPTPPDQDPIDIEVRAPRFASEMTRAGKRWLSALGVTDVGSFNERCVSGQVSRIIRAAESFHEKRIGALADSIVSRAGEVRVICVAGPSSSGKTTFLKRLMVQLEVAGVIPHGVSLDDYYMDREKMPRDERGDIDFEALETLDLAALGRDIGALVEGHQVTSPRFDFNAGKSIARGGHTLKLGKGDVLVIEGIHALNPRLLAGAVPDSAMFRVFVHPATVMPLDRLSNLSPVDVRLLRRIVRDRHGRSYTAAVTIARWPSVRRGERLHIYPHLPNADVVFDTFLPYEPSVLKVYAERYLLEVPRDHPSFPSAFRLRHLVDRFVAIHPEHVPPTSLIREFVGGSSFED